MKAISAIIFLSLISRSSAQSVIQPDTVIVRSGDLKLQALLWIPHLPGKLPAVIFSHGGYQTNDSTYDPVKNVSSIGSLFARHGYIFLGLFRRGVGLSKGQGMNTGDLMANAVAVTGQEGRNNVQLQKLETDELKDITAGFAFMRGRSDVDTNRLAIVGHSFGGSLALLAAERERALTAVVLFSAAGYSWDRSPALRSRLIKAAQHLSAPVMIIHARNDYSLNPGNSIDSTLKAMGKPHLLKIYPAFGTTNREGHNLIILGQTIWEADVFRFLDEIEKRR